MLIDWFTVGAQIVNFLILVWLLKRFAYKPILSAIDAREKRIVAQQAEAAANNAAAERYRDDLQEKTAAFDSDLGTKEARGAADIAQKREQQMTLARQDVERLRAAGQGQLLNERRNLGDRAIQMAIDAVLDAVRRALQDLGGVSVDERILEVFAARLRRIDVDVDAKDAFKAALMQAHTATVHSRFAIAGPARQALQESIDDAFGLHVPLDFTMQAAVIGGIEVSAAGQTLSWSMADYLRGFSGQLDSLLETDAPAVAPA